jgi:hypothetical protein
MCYTPYESGVPVEEIVAHLQEIVFTNYKLSIEEDVGTYIPGNNTAH